MDDLRFTNAEETASRLGISRRSFYYKVSFGELPLPIYERGLWWLADCVRASHGIPLPGMAAEQVARAMVEELEADRSRDEPRYTGAQRMKLWKTVRALNRQFQKAADARLAEIEEAAEAL